MKTIAYILLVVAGVMLVAFFIWAILSLFEIGLSEKTLFAIIFGCIASFGLIGRVIFVAIDSFKKDKLRK